MSNTMMCDYKRALYAIKDVFTKDDEACNTLVRDIRELIKLLNVTQS